MAAALAERVLSPESADLWGACRSCDGLYRLTNDLCAKCARRGTSAIDGTCTPSPVDGTCTLIDETPIAGRARLRPRWVIVVDDARRADGADDDALVIVAPADLTDVELHVLRLLAIDANIQLHNGASTTRAIAKIAGGRDDLADRIELVYGVRYDRWTVAYALRKLTGRGLIARSAPLRASKAMRRAGKLSGAIMYCLLGQCRRLGDLAADSLARARAQLGFIHGFKWPSSVHTYSGVTPIGREGRLQGAFRWAVEHARRGNRSWNGYWLTRRCIDCGLSEAEAMAKIEDYRDGLSRRGVLDDGYTLDEARRTVRSASKHHGGDLT